MSKQYPRAQVTGADRKYISLRIELGMLNLHMLQFVQTVYIPRIEMKIFQRSELEITPSNPVRISLFFVYSVYLCLRVGLNS